MKVLFSWQGVTYLSAAEGCCGWFIKLQINCVKNPGALLASRTQQGVLAWAQCHADKAALFARASPRTESHLTAST